MKNLHDAEVGIVAFNRWLLRIVHHLSMAAAELLLLFIMAQGILETFRRLWTSH